MSPSSTGPHTSRHGSGFISLAKLFLAVLLHAATTYASPLFRSSLHTIHTNEEPEPKPASDPSLYAYLGTAIALVLLGGAFAGLTIALMGQDEVYLQVISTSGEGAEKKNAAKVLRLLKRGKHWVLVTLLVGNVITNETLPLVLDRSIGGGYAAAISSTVLVIVFGEIVPQSICVRFGLPIGALMAPVVLAFMWVFAPITWPIAKLLDYLLGEDHGTVYKKSGLKTLVTLHKTMGTAPGERLNEDEVAIISGVLDLKSKPVGSILTPMNDVFTLSADARLDERMIEIIMREGYSRIPVHNPENKGDFVGMLLVKMLISYDPEDAKRVHEFALATLPETRPDTSCLDIINFFQEGKSHMVLVSDHPAQSYGALGVVTLEDVIEELIGEEIIDESDIFVDVHKGLRRLQPAPTHRHNRFKAQRGQFYEDNNSQAVGEEHQLATDGTVTRDDAKDDANDSDTERAIKNVKRGSTASIDRKATFMMRRPSNTSVAGSEVKPVQMNQNNPEFRSQMRNLGPSNIASRPRQTRINTVKVKPGVSTIPENKDVAKQMDKAAPESPAPDRSAERPVTTPLPTEAQEGIGQDYLESNHDAKDGVQALQQGYGTWDNKSPVTGRSKDDDDQHDSKSQGGTVSKEDETDPFDRAAKIIVGRTDSHSTLGSLHSADSGERGHRRKRTTARSGSITENIVERDGVKKLVLAASSSSEDEEAVQGQADKSRSRGPSHQGRNNNANGKSQASHSQASENGHDDSQTNGEGNSNGKSKRKKRPNRHRKKKEGGGGKDGDENTPLLSRD